MSPLEIGAMIEEGRHLVPPRLWPGLARYFTQRIEPGGFLCALLANDLREAVRRADDDSYAALRELLQFLYHFAPAHSHGSLENFQLWLAPPVAEAETAGRWDSAR